MNSIDVYANARSALRERLLRCDGLPENIAWEGAVFTAPARTAWLKESLLPGQVMRRSLQRTDAYQRVNLIYQIDCVAPVGTGTAWLDRITDTIRRAYDAGERLTYNDLTVQVRSASPGPRIADPPEWVRAPVRVDCFAYILTVIE